MTDFAHGDFENPLDALATPDPDTDTNPTSPEAEAVQPDEGQGAPDASTTDTPSAVQPEGQGQPDATTGLFDEYLSSVPEEHRSAVEQYLKDAERNVNGKLQESAEAVKTWEPFAELGLQDVGAEGIGALLEFAQDLSNPETARDALLAIAEAAGVDLSDAGAPQGDGGDEIDQDTPLTRAEFEAWQQQQRAQWEQDQQMVQLREQAAAELNKEFAAVEALNGKPFDATPGSGSDGKLSERQELIALAKRFQPDHDEPIKAAFQLMQRIRGQAEASLVNGQPTPPVAAEHGGRASSTVEPVDDFDTALRLHVERNASAHA